MDGVQITQQAPQSARRIGGLLVGKYGHRPRNPVEQELLDVPLVPQPQPAVRRTEMAVVQRGFDDERIGVDPVLPGPLFEPVDKKTTNRFVLVLLRGIEDHPHGFPLLSFAGLCLVAHATGCDEQAGPRTDRTPRTGAAVLPRVLITQAPRFALPSPRQAHRT